MAHCPVCQKNIPYRRGGHLSILKDPGVLDRFACVLCGAIVHVPIFNQFLTMLIGIIAVVGFMFAVMMLGSQWLSNVWLILVVAVSAVPAAIICDYLRWRFLVRLSR